jgi:hypothetical protein
LHTFLAKNQEEKELIKLKKTASKEKANSWRTLEYKSLISKWLNLKTTLERLEPNQ